MLWNLAMQQPSASPSSPPPAVQEIAEEMDRLFQRQIALMKSETFAGLTPAELQEYDEIGQRIHRLFAELARHK